MRIHRCVEEALKRDGRGGEAARAGDREGDSDVGGERERYQSRDEQYDECGMATSASAASTKEMRADEEMGPLGHCSHFEQCKSTETVGFGPLRRRLRG